MPGGVAGVQSIMAAPYADGQYGNSTDSRGESQLQVDADCVRGVLHELAQGCKVLAMSAALKPIKRVWKPKAPTALPVQAQFDIYGQEIHSIWDTYDALQAAEAERLAKLPQP